MITAKSLWLGGLGRFGNQCYTLASMIGIAAKNGQPFGVRAWINQDNALFGDNPDDMSQFFVNPLPELPDGLTFQDIPYHWEYRDYNIPTGNWNIHSHLQDPRYFKDYMPLIRHYFKMKDEPEQNDYVAIHYRAGDYIDDPKAYHPRCSKEYYAKALIGYIPTGSHCVLFSDDLKKAESMIGGLITGAGMTFEVFSGNYIEDFRAMKRCKSFITANSSFSAFAAMLGEHPDKKIIMPSRWFGEAAGGMKSYIYPEGAIII